MRFEHQSLRQGLVGAWCPSLGASGLSLIDRSGRGVHGTLTNMGGQSNWRANGTGVALNFDGTNDFVTLPASSDRSSVVWVSMWWRLTTAITPSTGAIYQLFNASLETSTPFRQNLSLGFNVLGVGPSLNTGRLAILTFDNNSATAASGAYTTTDYSSAINVWYHASGGWDGAAWRLFVDGVQQTNAEATQRAATVTPANIGYVGALGATFGRYSPVMVDDIRVYNRALTLTEIRLLASRRGIGLQPLPDRAVSLPRKLFVNVGGTWRDGDAYVNVGGTWKLGTPFVNAGGTWK